MSAVSLGLLMLSAAAVAESSAPGANSTSTFVPTAARLTSLSEVWSQLILFNLRDFWALIGPGGRLHPQDFIEHNGHLFIEGFLLIVISYLLFQRSTKPGKPREQLTEKEIDQLCDEWYPEPLCQHISEVQQQYEPPVITSHIGRYVVADGKKVLNMVSYNFLGVADNKSIEEKCRDTINEYGVGSCGPRGFYGTIDVHLQLELRITALIRYFSMQERLASFLRVDEAIIYSYDLATVPSIIPAFASAKDLIICDEGVAYAIQNGCTLSRAKILKFKHNDMRDLERVLKQVARDDRRQRKPLNRRFIIVEGIYAQFGDLAPLDEIYALKQKYKYRLLVDESLSLGVLGRTGRGACEHFGLHPSADVEIIAASMGNALGAIGGFCAGEREIVDHQRLSGQGYCFSASLPPYLASAAIGALDVLEAEAQALLPRLAANADLMRASLAKVPGLRDQREPASIQLSPLIHAQLAAPPVTEEEAAAVLQRIVDDAFEEEGVLFTVHRNSHLDAIVVPPSIKIVVCANHDQEDIRKAIAALRVSTQRVLQQSDEMLSPRRQSMRKRARQPQLAS